MGESCELLENCEFFNTYKANTEVIRRGWFSMFCGSKELSARCKRKRIRLDTGSLPPDNMAPTGDIILFLDKS